jgi:hypothetical protein
MNGITKSFINHNIDIEHHKTNIAQTEAKKISKQLTTVSTNNTAVKERANQTHNLSKHYQNISGSHCTINNIAVARHIDKLTTEIVNTLYSKFRNRSIKKIFKNNQQKRNAQYNNQSSEEQPVDERLETDILKILIELTDHIALRNIYTSFEIYLFYKNKFVGYSPSKLLITVIPYIDGLPQTSQANIFTLKSDGSIKKHGVLTTLFVGGFLYTHDWLEVIFTKVYGTNLVGISVINDSDTVIKGFRLHRNIDYSGNLQHNTILHVPGFWDVWK